MGQRRRRLRGRAWLRGGAQLRAEHECRSDQVLHERTVVHPTCTGVDSRQPASNRLRIRSFTRMKPSAASVCRKHIVVSASSMGGIDALTQLLKRLPADFPAPIVVVQHRGTALPSYLPEVLQRSTKLRVMHGHAGERLRPGHVYVASPEQHIVVGDDYSLHYIDGQKINFLRSSADPLFESASKVYGRGAIGVVLTGYDRDATAGSRAIKARGGIVIAQSPDTCQIPEMPSNAIRAGSVDMVLPIDEIAAALVRLVEPNMAT